MKLKFNLMLLQYPCLKNIYLKERIVQFRLSPWDLQMEQRMTILLQIQKLIGVKALFQHYKLLKYLLHRDKIASLHYLSRREQMDRTKVLTPINRMEDKSIKIMEVQLRSNNQNQMIFLLNKSLRFHKSGTLEFQALMLLMHVRVKGIILRRMQKYMLLIKKVTWIEISHRIGWNNLLLNWRFLQRGVRTILIILLNTLAYLKRILS